MSHPRSPSFPSTSTMDKNQNKNFPKKDATSQRTTMEQGKEHHVKSAGTAAGGKPIIGRADGHDRPAHKDVSKESASKAKTTGAGSKKQ